MIAREAAISCIFELSHSVCATLKHKLYFKKKYKIGKVLGVAITMQTNLNLAIAVPITMNFPCSSNDIGL